MNNPKNSFRKILWSIGVLLLGNACTSFFEDYNTNQHAATEEHMAQDNLKMGAFFSQMMRNVVLFDERSPGGNLSSTYQVAQGLTADIYAEYYAPTGTWHNGMHNGCYYFISDWIEQTFRSGFTKIMPAWLSITKIAEELGQPELAALATVLKVQGMHRVADSYGPIPYGTFGSSLQSEYNSLEEVYRQFHSELDEAIDVLTTFVTANPDVKLIEKYDIVYAGDITKWVKFANTLRLRLALRVVYADASLAQTQGEKSVANPIGFVDSPDNRAALQHSRINYYHPLYDIKDFNDGEARMSAAMDVFLRGYNDPRMSVYFRAPEAGGAYCGVRLGLIGSMANYVAPTVSKLNIDLNTEIVWMTAAESHFLRAEGALRGWAGFGSDQTHYNNGLTASFNENQVSIGSYASSTAAPAANYTPPAGGIGGVSRLTTITPQWSASAAMEVKLERIITQKWIALYPDGPEAWAEYRRTGYPMLFGPHQNNSNGTIPSGTPVRRIPFPPSEHDLNAAGYASGVAKLGGLDNGSTRLWWDKK